MTEPRSILSLSCSHPSPLGRGITVGRLAMTRCCLLALLIFCFAVTTVFSAEQKISASDLQFFENKIRPILLDNCYKCHSQGAEKIKGGLLLDTRDGARKGGNTARAVIPGNDEKSLRIQAVRYKDKELE